MYLEGGIIFTFEDVGNDSESHLNAAMASICLSYSISRVYVDLPSSFSREKVGMSFLGPFLKILSRVYSGQFHYQDHQSRVLIGMENRLVLL